MTEVVTVVSPQNSAKFMKKKKDVIPKPDLQSFKEQLDQKRQIISKLTAESNQIRDRVTELSAGQSAYTKRRDEMRQQLDEVTKEIEATEAERVRLFNDLEELQKTSRDKKSRLQSLKKNLKFQTEEDIDHQIQILERHMMSLRLSVPEENKIIAQINQLKAEKPKLGQYVSIETKSSASSQTALAPLRTQYDEIRLKLQRCQQKKKKLTDEVRELVKSNQKVIDPIRDLNQEREQIRKEIISHKREEAQLMDIINKKFKEYHASVAQAKKATSEKKREERRQREIDFEKDTLNSELEDLENDTSSFELIMLQQTMQYVKKLIQNSDLDPSVPLKNEETPALEDATKPVDSENSSIQYMKQKDQRNVQRAKKKFERKKKQSSRQPLVHSIATLADFDKIGVSPPLTLEDCPSCLETLQKRLEVLETEKKNLDQSLEKKKEEILSKLQALEAQVVE